MLNTQWKNECTAPNKDYNLSVRDRGVQPKETNE